MQRLANDLGLPVHERDTFTGWQVSFVSQTLFSDTSQSSQTTTQMPEPGGEPINLIIAVSFGLFVPPRLLRAAQYGGLNIHPSLLPE
jgi:methionyl-tRNA formyltransferase